MLRHLPWLFAVVLLAGCDSRTQPSAEESSLLLTATDFGLAANAGNPRLRRSTNYLTRSVELSYQYQQKHELFLHSAVSLLPNAADAAFSSYGAIQGGGIGIGRAKEDVTQEVLPLERTVGSHAELILLRSAGKPFGNMFSVSIGKKMFFTIFTGRYFESAADFEDFIAPKLAILEAHEHEDPLLTWGKGLFSEDDQAQ